MLYSSTKSKIRAATLVTATLLTSPVFAHSGHHQAVDIVSGFMHPLLGIDHLLAMLAVGIWAAQYRQPARWMLLLLFPTVMALGAVAGMMAVHLPGIEPGIAGSVAVLGLLIAFAIKMPAAASGIVVALFALIHGYAHGVELPAGASPVLYGAGFILATLTLHAIGLVIGMAAAGKVANKAMRLLGGAIAASGAYLLVSAG
ncbi:MAG: urease accessory protein [Burkholderiales bacterium RIFCSPLOWO2_02_FULL_57_36]|nr:MAG: urease accessory protein [Burkholderiales bacterium RIFCSPLOWO2_02_FULL_57_36]